MSSLTATTAGPRLTVDLDAVASNVRALRGLVAGSVVAVVKADAFGHGAVAVARTALANGASALGVATLTEAIELRDAGLTARVLSWLNPVSAAFETGLRRDIQFAVPSLAHLAAITSAAKRSARTAEVHVHVDTGMARDGASRSEWAALFAEARRAEREGLVRVVGVMSHLPCAGEQHPSTEHGRRAFLDAVHLAHDAGLRPATLHLGATQAALNAPDTHFDAVRVGAGLYGIGEGLRPALTLTAPIIGIRSVSRGTPVGYGLTWRAPRDTRLALLPLGYADGLPRLAGPVAHVTLRDRPLPIAGTISMDQTVVDLGDCDAQPGDEVTVFGDGSEGEPTVSDWAAWANTIPHEIMTGLGARLERRYRSAP